MANRLSLPVAVQKTEAASPSLRDIGCRRILPQPVPHESKLVDRARKLVSGLSEQWLRINQPLLILLQKVSLQRRTKEPYQVAGCHFYQCRRSK